MKELKFVHITKTAGSSIEKCALKKGILWGAFDPIYKEKVGFWHKPPEDLLNEYDLFCVIRNPYSRCLSEFYCNFNGIKKKVKINKKKFNILIRDKILNNRSYYHWTPQYEYIKSVKHILHFENLKEEFSNLMKLYNLPVVLNQKLNKSSKIYGIKDFDSETISLIQEIYNLDFALGYSKEILGKKLQKSIKFL